MGIRRSDPYGELVSLREAMNRLFEESFVRPSGPAGRQLTESSARPLAVDVYQTANEVVIKASVPGVRPEDVEITLLGDTVTIRAELPPDETVAAERYLRRERYWGSFSRQVVVPVALQADRAEAHFDSGVLTLIIPKAEVARPKQIRVQTTDQQSD